MNLKNIISAKNSIWIFTFSLCVVYLLIPLYAYLFDNEDKYNTLLMFITLVSCIFLIAGYNIPLFDNKLSSKFKINREYISYVIIFLFSLFLFVTFATAENIPIFSYFSGADANELSQQRGALFKGREGWQAILLYLFTLFAMALVPYAIAAQFISKNWMRYISLIIFFLFTISFLQKALFVNALLPLVFSYSIIKHKTNHSMWIAIAVAVLLLYALTTLSMGSDIMQDSSVNMVGPYFSADYQPSSPLDMLLWRAIAVPVFTATDTLNVFYTRLSGEYLFGATSSFITAITGDERVNIERFVFEYQWGWNDTANANAVYFVDAFVNFGWIGVCGISLVIGQTLRWFRDTEDQALAALWPIYCLSLFNASIIGLLLSNGFLLVWAMLLFTKPRENLKSHLRRTSHHGSIQIVG